VSGYPTIKYYEYGPGKKVSNAQDYQGERKAAALIEFANRLLDAADIEPEILELNKQSVYDDNCQGNTICVIAILPNIYESSAEQRNGHLTLLKDLAKSNRNSRMTHFWM
jgi:hypothetical protein